MADLVPVDLSNIQLDTHPSGMVPVDLNSVELDGQKPSLTQDLEKSFEKNQNSFDTAENSYHRGEQGLGSTVLQGTGAIANNVGDTIGDLINHTPVIGSVAHGIMNAAMNNPVVDYGAAQIQPTTDAINNKINEQSPEFQRNIQGLGGIANMAAATVAPETDAGQAAIQGVSNLTGAAQDTIGTAGTALKDSGQAAQDAARQDYIQDLVMPLANGPKAKAKLVARTTVDGPFNTATVQPNLQEIASAGNIGDIEGVSPKNTIQQNRNAINEANIAEAEKLSNKLSQYPVTTDHISDLDSALNDASDSLSKNVTLTGDSQKIGQSLVDKTKEILAGKLQNGPLTMSDILQVRKDLDSYVTDSKPSVFDPNTENGLKAATKTIRNTLNNFVDTNSPNASVKQSLAKQNSYYNALKNIDPKAAKEAPTAIGRFAQSASNILPWNNHLVNAGTGLGGLGLTGWAALSHPALTAAAAGIGGLTKLATMPETRIGLGNLMEKIGGVTPETAAPLALPAPPSELVTDWNGQTRLQTPEERDSAILDRQRAQQLGMTPDIRQNLDNQATNNLMQQYGGSDLGQYMAQNKNMPIAMQQSEIPYTQYDDNQARNMITGHILDKLDQMKQQRINDQINDAWQQHGALSGMISDAQNRTSTLNNEIGQPETLMSQAFRNAKTVKKDPIQALNEARSTLRSINQ